MTALQCQGAASMWASPCTRSHDPVLGVTLATMQLSAPGRHGSPLHRPPEGLCENLPPFPVLRMLTLGGVSALESPLHAQVQDRDTWSAPQDLVPGGGGHLGQGGLSFL